MPIYETITALTADRAELHLLRTRDWLGGPARTACGDEVVATSSDRSIADLLAGGTIFLCDEWDDDRPRPAPGVRRATPHRPPCPRCQVVRAMLNEPDRAAP